MLLLDISSLMALVSRRALRVLEPQCGARSGSLSRAICKTISATVKGVMALHLPEPNVRSQICLYVGSVALIEPLRDQQEHALPLPQVVARAYPFHPRRDFDVIVQSAQRQRLSS